VRLVRGSAAPALPRRRRRASSKRSARSGVMPQDPAPTPFAATRAGTCAETRRRRWRHRARRSGLLRVSCHEIKTAARRARVSQTTVCKVRSGAAGCAPSRTFRAGIRPPHRGARESTRHSASPRTGPPRDTRSAQRTKNGAVCGQDPRSCQLE
jgi:hypothetical protein